MSVADFLGMRWVLREKSGQEVVEQKLTAGITGRDNGGHGMPDFAPGQRATFTKTITESDINAFAGITGDFNPLHVNAEYAARARFGERIAHGMLTAGLISTVLGMRLPGPGGIFLSQSLRFVKPVRIGDTVTAEAEVTGYRADKRILTLRTSCRNQHGETVIEGESVLLVDPVPD